MPCHDVTMPSGINAIACVRGSKGGPSQRCSGCGRRCSNGQVRGAPTARLCDIPIGEPGRGGKRPTCSAVVCSSCAVRIGDEDVCPLHPVPDEVLVTAPGGGRWANGGRP